MTVTVEQVMEAWGIDDLVIHIPRHDDGTTRVCVNSVTVDERSARLPRDEWMKYRTPTRYSSVIGIGSNHTEALECALRNAGVEPGQQADEAAFADAPKIEFRPRDINGDMVVITWPDGGSTCVMRSGCGSRGDDFVRVRVEMYEGSAQSGSWWVQTVPARKAEDAARSKP